MTISDDWDLTQNSKYLDLQESSLNSAQLKWCSLFAKILNGFPLLVAFLELMESMFLKLAAIYFDKVCGLDQT